jgi:hypothetical protein
MDMRISFVCTPSDASRAILGPLQELKAFNEAES